jgi:hypothetical protein
MNRSHVRRQPHLLSFIFGQVFALVNLKMAFKAQRRDQIVISLYSSTLTAAPIGVRCLHHIA